MNASVPAGTFINEHDALSFMRECDALSLTGGREIMCVRIRGGGLELPVRNV